MVDDPAPRSEPDTPPVEAAGIPLLDESVSVVELYETVKLYAQQETIGPLRNAGRWTGYGALGALLLGSGIALILLGVLRLIQTEWPETFDGAWSWVPYLIVLVLAGLVIWFALSRVHRHTLAKEPT